MSATVIIYWQGITEEQIDGEPGFYNDDNAWGSFIAEREDEPEVKRIIIELGAEPILTYTTEGLSDEQVYWVTPRELYNAAEQLETAIRLKSPGTERVLAVYERGANLAGPVEEEFIQDLEDIKVLASWAENEGAQLVTLEVNW